MKYEACGQVQPKARAIALHGEDAETWWEDVRCVYPAEHADACSWADDQATYQRRLRELDVPGHKRDVLSERNRRERRRMKRMARAGSRSLMIGPLGLQLGRTPQEQAAFDKRVAKRRKRKKGGR